MLNALIAISQGGEDCLTAVSINSLPFVDIGNTMGATDDLFESCPDIGNQGGAPDLVYRYTTGNSTEIVNVSLCEAVTDYDSQLYIYANGCNTTPIGCMEDGCQSPVFNAPYNSNLEQVNLLPNTTYFFVIDGYDANSFGNYQLNIEPFNPVNPIDSTLLPIVVINTNQQILDEPKIPGEMGIIYNGAGFYNHMGDAFNQYEGAIGIETRGSSSQSFPKKGYAIETRDPLGNNNNVSIFGMPDENDWILVGPFSDKSLIRNYLAYTLGSRLRYYSPRVQFCEVVLNNDYRGVYLWTEKIKRDNGRLNLSKLDEFDTAGVDLTGGYILKLDKYTGLINDSWQSAYSSISSTPQTINYLYHYPKPDVIIPAQKEYIQSYIASFENALAGPDFLDEDLGYRNYIETNSFVDLMLLNEISRNVDGYRLSTFFYKNRSDIDNRIYVGPPWDYNLAFGNPNYCNGSEIAGWSYDFNNVCPGDPYHIPFWWEKMLSDPYYLNKLNCQWNTLREGPFHTDSILQLIDDAYILLEEPAQRNFNKFDILNTYVWPNNFIGGSYQSEINYLKNWITDRLLWMDNNLPGDTIDCSFLSNQTINQQLNLRVFPNPSNDFVFIETNPSSNYELHLFDPTGKELPIKYESMGAGIMKLDIRNLTPSIYSLVIKFTDELKSLKLIVQ